MYIYLYIHTIHIYIYIHINFVFHVQNFQYIYCVYICVYYTQSKFNYTKIKGVILSD